MITVTGIILAGGFLLEFSTLRRIFYKIEDFLRPPVTPLPDSKRENIKFRNEGFKISVEKALNSRCTSDYDGNPRKFHWGMFDQTKKLSDSQIKEITDLARVCRFTDSKVEVQLKGNVLYFVVDNSISGMKRKWAMIESGMQQQAIGLVCAALGVGMVFASLGDDGTPLSETMDATTRIKLDAMQPSYDGSYWSISPPVHIKSWRTGNLPDPVRDGDKSLLSILGSLKIRSGEGEKTTEKSISQLLWAARGRTPHYYKSMPWGMTIPASRGEQNITSVYTISQGKLFKYSNWSWNRPTHSLEILANIDADLREEMRKIFLSNDNFIIIGKNENFARALWEVGYQLLNLLLQANALGLSFEAVLLDEDHRNLFQRIGIADPAALLRLNCQDL